MAVTITWSATLDGAALSEPVSHGSIAAGNTLPEQTVYLKHDGVNAITGCKFYLAPYSGSYTGGATAAADLAEILGWGDGVTLANFGGFQLNMDYDGGFPLSAWPAYNDKQPAGGSAVYTGVGDSATNGIVLPITMGLDTAGVIPAGDVDVAFKCRIHVPSAEGTTGTRQFDQKLRFTYTS